VVTPTDRQAKPEAACKIHRTQRDVCQFFIQPATPRPPAEPDPASRPLVKQAAPCPPAEPVPAPRPPVKHARAISDFFTQPAAPRPPAEPDPAPRPLRSKLHHAPRLLHLNKRLFEMPLELRLRTQSHDQSAWIHLVAPTV
jgi:hypothetical protein